MAGFVPAISIRLAVRPLSEMPGTTPGMTKRRAALSRHRDGLGIGRRDSR